MRASDTARPGEALEGAIRKRVLCAVLEGEIIRSGPEAAKLNRTFPGSGLSTTEISEKLVRAALKAGVATELCPPEEARTPAARPALAMRPQRSGPRPHDGSTDAIRRCGDR
jgi:hypothetical protein